MTNTFTPPGPLKTAVLFLVFNRPDPTAQVFEAIRQAKPPRLYVAADGPREGREGEAERVARVRKIATAVDWPCEVNTLFRERNLGCKNAVSSAITWFFDQEEQGIILEDDCLPSQSFFWFCEFHLSYYSNEKSIFAINGSNYLTGGGFANSRLSYIFTDPDVWGWATWRDRWAFYADESLSIRKNIFSKNYLLFALRHYPIAQEIALNSLSSAMGQISSWAYPWTLSVLSSGGICITPGITLIDNIGFGEEATHTKNGFCKKENRKEILYKTISVINYDMKLNTDYLKSIHKRSVAGVLRNFLVLAYYLVKSFTQHGHAEGEK